jgi:hypothetical protein
LMNLHLVTVGIVCIGSGGMIRSCLARHKLAISFL